MFGTREEHKYDSNKPENITLIGTGKQIDAHESNTFAKSPNYNTSKVGFIEEAVKKFSQKSTKNEEKSSSHNRDTEDIAKKEKRKIEHVQDTSRTSPEDQTLINKKFRRHREGFGIEKYLKAVGQIALSAIEDYDVVKGYRAVKDIGQKPLCQLNLLQVTGFFSNDDDEIPLAVKMADYIELELFGPFVRDCALKAERKRPSVPEIDNYDKIIVSFEDTDGNTFNSLRNTKDILAMAHVYFENAYADSEGEYKESTYKKYCKQLFENSCSYKFKESPVTYCGGCKTRTIRHSVSECPDPAIYSYTYPDEDGNPVTDSFTYCPSHQEIYCPGHMTLYVIFVIRQFDDTISLTINDKMGLKERDAWEGWYEDMIEAVKDLMRKNWEKEYNYIYPEY